MIIAVMMVKDEADIVASTVENLFRQGVDRLLVADNMSGDGTREILERMSRDFDVVIHDDFEPGYYQSEKTTRLAVQAWEQGAEWVLPVDADELWYGCQGTIRECLADVDAEIVRVFGYDHIPQRTDDPSLSPVRRIRWRRLHPQPLPKVCFRAGPSVRVGMGNHDVEGPGRVAVAPVSFRHFQWRSFEQMRRKVRQGKAAYDATGLPACFGAHWRELGALSDVELMAEWRELLGSVGLIEDPCPFR